MPANKVATVGIVGAGSMGGAMALLFSEKGDQIVMYDTTKSSVDKVLENAKKAQIDLLVADSYADLVSRFDVPANGPRIIVFSLPHGAPVDGVLNALLPHLAPGDVILDGGNEWYEETERRQGKALAKGVHYVGCGVSGGYQSARRGPSMSPGCSPEAYKIVESRLKKWAAKDRSGKPCVDLMGPGGSGHYVKMLHNGIEQGHLSVLAEAHHLLHFVAGLSNDEVADIWDEWNGTRELEEDYANAQMGGEGKELMDNFLVKIGANIMRFKKGAGMDLEKGIVDGIEDKVTQDIDNSEGTGVWSVRELAARHIPAPTIAAAHQLRLTSGPRGARQIVAKELKLPQPTQLKDKDGFDVKAFVEDVRLAVYAGILGAYIQGMNIIAEADKEEGWRLNYAKIISIWRSGCIIKSTAISDLIQPLFEKDPDNHHLLEHPEVAAELKKTYAALKRVCVIGIQTDSTIPSLDATLGWMKSLGAEELPTNFEEAELDYFGHHNFDKRTENAPDPVKGKNHVEWAPA